LLAQGEGVSGREYSTSSLDPANGDGVVDNTVDVLEGDSLDEVGVEIRSSADAIILRLLERRIVATRQRHGPSHNLYMLRNSRTAQQGTERDYGAW
jgi:hypothetical protein